MIAFMGRLPHCVASGAMVATCIATLCAPAQAQVAPPFATLLSQTADAPRRVESEAGVRRSEGLARQARARPNPTIGVLTENVAGPSPYRGFDRAETTLQYSQPLEIGGKRSARIAAGEAGVVASRARDRDAQLRYAYDLARAYAAAEDSDQRILRAEDEVEEAESILRVARALVNAGKEARLRALQAEAQLNALKSDLEIAKANRIAAYAQLSALAGVEEAFTGLSESLLTPKTALPAFGPVDPMANVAYLAARAESESAERRLTAELKRAIPDITAIVGVRRLEFESATALTAGVSIPLHIFDRNRGNIAASQADVQAASARLAMARNDAIAQAKAATAQIDAAQSRVAAAEASHRTAQEAYRLARIAYEAGKAPLSELLIASQGVGTALDVVLDARLASFEARAMLARLQGRTITGEPIQ